MGRNWVFLAIPYIFEEYAHMGLIKYEYEFSSYFSFYYLKKVLGKIVLVISLMSFVSF